MLPFCQCTFNARFQLQFSSFHPEFDLSYFVLRTFLSCILSNLTSASSYFNFFLSRLTLSLTYLSRLSTLYLVTLIVTSPL